jgi:hypothetical protein
VDEVPVTDANDRLFKLTEWQTTTCFVAILQHKKVKFNPLNAELKPICHLPVLLGAPYIYNLSRLRIKNIFFVTPLTL